MKHYTAWVTNDPTAVENGLVNVTVLEDQLVGEDPQDHGSWSCMGSGDQPPPFYAQTTVDAEEGDMEDALAQARKLLEGADWQIVTAWEATPSAYIAAVERT